MVVQDFANRTLGARGVLRLVWLLGDGLGASVPHDGDVVDGPLGADGHVSNFVVFPDSGRHPRFNQVLLVAVPHVTLHRSVVGASTTQLLHLHK